LIARYGGEEFVAILRGMDEARAIAVSEECRVAIESAEWSWRQVTASFGVSTFHAEIGSLDDFVKEADDALYRSKHDGRNRVTHHSALPDQTVAA
jgi:diguanylate cyclase (GGDEF)-like protein